MKVRGDEDINTQISRRQETDRTTTCTIHAEASHWVRQ